MKRRFSLGRKTVIWIAAAALCLLAVVGTAIYASAQGEEQELTTTYSFTGLSKYFKRADLTVVSAAGGYSADAPEKLLEMYFEFLFDDVELWNKSEEIIASNPDFPKQRNLSNEEWLVLIRRWLAENPDVCEPIEFTTRVRDNNGLIQLADESGVIHSDSGEKIGTFAIADGQLSVYLDSVVYFMEDVDFTLELQARVSVYDGSEDSYEIVVNDRGEVESEKAGEWEAKQNALPVPAYTISKSGPEKTDSPFVTYTINIAANNGESLAGKKLVELIPAGMVLADAEVRINGGTERNVFNEMKNGVYTFSEEDSGATSAVFSVTLSLSEEKLLEYYSGGINETFRNTAQLVGSEPGVPLAQSNTVATTMKSSFIEKKGRAVNSEETRYEWSVDIRTSLPYMKCGYLVDRLSADDQMYDFSKGITVYTDDAEDGIIYITEDNIVESQSWQGVWEELNAGAMYADGAGLDTRFFNPPKAYYYFVETDKNNIFSSVDGKEHKQDCYLVIPYYGLQGGAYETKEVTFVYETERNMHGFTNAADYWSFVEDYLKNGGTDFSRQQSNDVTFVWENDGGEGIIGGVVPENVDYGKEIESDPAILVKQGEYYNASTMTASWVLDVDKLGFEVDNAVVTDVLDPTVYDLDTLSVKMTVNDLAAQTSGGQTELAIAAAGEVPAETAPTPCCTLNASDGTLSINLGDIHEGCSYSFVIEAKVISPELLSTQSRDQTLRNAAAINYVLNGEPHEYSTDALLNVPNTLLTKKAVGKYNCDERTLTWSLTVGKNGLDIRNGVITDTLPDGFEYVPGSAVVSPAGLALTDTLSADGREVYFGLGESFDKQYTVTFKTRATQQWIDDNLVYHGEDGEEAIERTINVVNNAVLNGTVNGSPIKDADGEPGAKAHASNTAPVSPISKYGVYKAAEGAIDWVVELNRVHYSIGGKHLVEALSEELELVPDSVRITADDGSDISYEVTKKDDTGFVIAFKDHDAVGGRNTNRYRMEFRTLLTTEAAGKTISNRVELYDESGRRFSESGYSDGGYDGSYVPANDSRAHLRPILHVHKLSGNSVETTWGVYSDENSLGLEDAEFTLNAYGFTVENGVVTLGDIVYSKVEYTDDTGDIYFGNLRTSNNNGEQLLFTLKETKAPTGYVADGSMKFVYFRRETAENDRLGGVITAVLDSEGNTLASGDNIMSRFYIMDSESSAGAGCWKRVECDFTNAPDVNTLVISKETFDWSSYGGTARFFPVGEGVKFKVRQKNVFQLREQTFETDSTGTARIADLDPGVYTVTELDQPYGMEPVSFELTVKCLDQAENRWEYKIDGKVVEADGNGVFSHLIKNEPAVTDLTINKKIHYSYGKNESASAVSVKLHLVSVTPEDKGGVPDEKIDRTVATKDGAAVFDKLPVGNYQLFEVCGSAPGYKVNDLTGELQLYDIAITQNSDGSLKTVFTPAQKDESTVICKTDGTVSNIPVTGTVRFSKSSVSDIVSSLNGEPVKGAEFGLYLRIGNSYYSPPAYKAVSDENGVLTFKNVEYGNYYLAEVTAPEGYDALSKYLKAVSRSSFTLVEVNGKYTFDYTAPASDRITNTLHTENLSFTKTDIDGNLLSGVTFDIYRRGSSAVGADSSGFVTAVPQSCNTYYSYGLLENITTDEKGAASFTLPYGDYLLVERTEGEDDIYDLKENASHAALLINVRGDGTSLTKYSSGSPIPFDNGCYTVDTSADGWGKTAKNARNSDTKLNTFSVVNERKYAFIQINKTAGDLLADGTTAVYADYPLAEKTFAVSRGGKEYFTLKTQADGTLAAAANGSYSEKKLHLWYGDYTIKETGLPNGFSVPETAFTISDSTTGDGGTMLFSYNGGKVWFSWDGGTVWHAADGSIASGADRPDGNFVNYLERSPFEVKKLGADGKPLAGAEFGLWLGSVKIADFTDNGDGSYTMASTGETDGNGVPYVVDGNRLLKGSYTLKETKAPAGYLIAGSFTVRVTGNDSIEISVPAGNTGSAATENGGRVLVITDELVLRDIDLSKVFTGTESPVANIVFELFKAGKSQPFAEMTTGADGRLTFADVPEGSYILRENYEKSIEAGAADYVRISDREYQVEVSAQQPGGMKSVLTIDGKTIEKNGVFTVENDRMSASIELTKVDAEDTSLILPGVKFKLEKLGESGYVPVYRNNNGGTFITDGSGRITVNELERGSYRLTETEPLTGYKLDPPLVITFVITNADHGTVKTVKAGEKWFKVVSGEKLLCAAGVKNSHICGTLSLAKVDGADGAPLNGVEFTLIKDGKEEYTLRSGYEYSSPDDGRPKATHDGVLSVGQLEWGSYVLRETAPLRGYCFGEESEWQFDVGLKPNGRVYFDWNIGEVKNNKNEIRLEKTDALTGKGLGNAVYTVTDTSDPSDSLSMKTNASGSAVLTGSLMAGRTYRLTEASAPYGYEKSGEAVIFTMGADGKAYIASNASADNIFRFADQPKKGSVVFEKRIIAEGLSALDGAPLAGAEFELRRVLDGKELKTGEKGYAVYTTVSGRDGKVTFTGIPFGDYNLYEKSAPAGFTKPAGSAPAVKVLREKLTVTKDGFTADYSKNAITNTLISGKLELLKTEKREGAMSNISFGVFRRGSNVVSADGSGFEPAPESSVGTYYRYLPCAELTTDRNGIITTRLPYGDYLLVEETSELALVDDASYVYLLVQVRQNSVSASVLTSGSPLTAIRDGFRVDMSAGWRTAAKDGSRFVVENERKLALIDLRKVAGNVTDSGKTVSFDDSPISGVSFTVTRKGEGKPLFTAVTGKDGHLIADKNGESYSGKYLRCGTYILAETGTDISCEFTVRKDAPNLSTYWFSYDGRNVTCSIDPDESRRGAFINIVERSPFEVKTTDGTEEEALPENVEFEIFSKDNPEEPAAKATVNENGECKITDGTAADGDSIPYCVDGKLLPGEYILSVKNAPEGYLTPADRLLTVSGNGEVTLDGEKEKPVSESDAVTVQLERIIGDISLRKIYAGEKYADAQANEKLPEAVAKTTFVKGLTFILCNSNGVPLLSKDDSGILAPVTAVTDEQGVAVFKNVGEGSYIIREDVKRSLASGAPDDVYLDSTKQVRVTVRANEIRNSTEVVRTLADGTVVPVSGNIIVEDERVAASVKLVKTASDTGEPLAGVSFKLDRAPAGSTVFEPYRTALTDREGVILLENLPKGNYKLSEIGTLSGYSAAEFPVVTFEIENKVYSEVLEVRKGQSWFSTEAGAASITPDGIVNTPIASQNPAPANRVETKVIQSESPNTNTTQPTQGSILKTVTYSSNDKRPSVAAIITRTASSAGSRLMNNGKQTNAPTTTMQESSPHTASLQQSNTLTDSKQQNNSLTTGGKQQSSNRLTSSRQEFNIIVDGDSPNPNTGSEAEIRLCIELIGLSLSAALLLLPKLRRRIRG